MDSGPPPPPHGANSKASGLPPGNYDIFIIPPHSSGSGFVYLPSLQPHRNSFLAGVACTLLAVGIWALAIPVMKQWLSTVVASGGAGVVLLVMGVGVLGWAFGKTQQENSGPAPKPGSARGPDPGANGSAGAHQQQQQQGPQQTHQGPPPNAYTSGFNPRPGPTFSADPRQGPYAGPKPTWHSANTGASTAGWEKAREEMKKREEERKKKEEAEKKAKEAEQRAQEAEQKAKDAEQKAKEAAEKERWEKARVREKEAREKEARDKAAQEKLRKEREARAAERAEKEKSEKERVEGAEKREDVERSEKGEREERSERSERVRRSDRAESEYTNPAAAAAAAAAAGGNKSYRKPTAQSFIDDEEIHSFRPYDTPSRRPAKASSQSSFYSEPSSYAPSQSTARTTPPRSQNGPYSTKDPDKIVIKAVYSFTDLFPKPSAQLVSGAGSVTDGLVLRITTEGLFIDDDVRNVPQREWDVKAWTMKLVESSSHANGKYHILRASIRDADSKKYVFVIDEHEAWKVAVGLQRLRRGNLVRSLGVQGFNKGEAEKLVGGLGWV